MHAPEVPDDMPPASREAREVSLLEAVGTAVVITDAFARIRFMNGAARTLHGLESDTGYVGAEYGSGFDMFDRQGLPVAEASSPVWQAARGRPVVAETVVVRFTDDETPHLWEYSASLVDADGPSPAVVLTIREIPDAFTDDRKVGGHSASEENLNAQSLDRLLELLPSGAAICDDQGRMLATNPRIEEIWGGMPRSESFDEFGIYRARWADTGTPLLPQDWAMYRAVMFGETCTGELLDIDRFDGGQATILNSAAPIRNERGVIVGAVAVLADVTEYMRRERLERQMVRAIPEILRARSTDVRIGVVAGLMDSMFMGSTVFVSVQEGGGLALTDRSSVRTATLLERHAPDVWDALKSLRARHVPRSTGSRKSSLLIIPVQSGVRAAGCFLTTSDGAWIPELGLDVAQQMVELLPSLFDAPFFDENERQKITSYSFSLAGPLVALLSDEVLGFEEPEWISSRVLELLMEYAEADYGRVVESNEGDSDHSLRALSEIGAEEGVVPIESLGLPAATVTGQTIIVAAGAEAPDSVGYESFASFPFVTDSGSGAITLAWLKSRDSAHMRAGDLALGAAFLGLLLSGSQLRSRLQRAQEAHLFVGAVAAAAASCFDAAGIRDAVANVVKRQFGSDAETHLFRMDSASRLREVAPTFTAAPAVVCDWSEVEGPLASSSTGVLLITPDNNPFCALLPLREGEQAVVAVLQLRGRPIGLMMTVLDGERDVDANMLSLLDAAAREVAEALAVAWYSSTQVRIAMRSRVAEAIEAEVRALSDEDDIIDAAVRTALAALKAEGIAHLRKTHAGWQVACWAGRVDTTSVVNMVDSAVTDVSTGSAILADNDTAVVSSMWIDEELCALVALRTRNQVPFSRDDLELLYRIHVIVSEAIRSLRLAREREALLVARERWLADISHDLKTPLSAIRAYAELLSSTGDTTQDEVRRQGGRILQQASGIQYLIDNLLLVFRIRAKALPVEMTVQDANDVASEAVQLVLADPRARGASVTLEGAPSPIPVAVDSRLLVRALSNVTMNAVVHGGAGVNVRVSVASEGSTCRIEVSDDGKGIEADNLDRVFDRYYRGDPARGDQAGSGLGLPIARELVELMGGTLDVDSSPGSGTTISIEFATSE
ncbi:MAG: PAS domain-containing sensor histidine kinase [Coriobacteriia bacterium]|nr:PAS domain-containing sensor histidine kinase [Coriobacteriia bacterium]